ncbi:hypothetical protein EGW08_001494 [Elysia chlorotica]|uniref:Uncharacterized protein n=1 Tax=Elysia chlorotica TaxID=188477 RepID=A0A3S1CEV5_ELYCH|nr:hypothetical protein EGW08_001494 [Elysia chlorotica]
MEDFVKLFRRLETKSPRLRAIYIRGFSAHDHGHLELHIYAVQRPPYTACTRFLKMEFFPLSTHLRKQAASKQEIPSHTDFPSAKIFLLLNGNLNSVAKPALTKLNACESGLPASIYLSEPSRDVVTGYLEHLKRPLSPSPVSVTRHLFDSFISGQGPGIGPSMCYESAFNSRIALRGEGTNLAWHVLQVGALSKYQLSCSGAPLRYLELELFQFRSVQLRFISHNSGSFRLTLCLQTYCGMPDQGSNCPGGQDSLSALI